MPEIRYDLPAGGRRLVQRVDGYDATLVSGVPVFENGDTPARRPAGWCAPGSSGYLSRKVRWQAVQVSPSTLISAA